MATDFNPSFEKNVNFGDGSMQTVAAFWGLSGPLKRKNRLSMFKRLDKLTTTPTALMGCHNRGAIKNTYLAIISG
jgi:hypothetical protein